MYWNLQFRYHTLSLFVFLEDLFKVVASIYNLSNMLMLPSKLPVLKMFLKWILKIKLFTSFITIQECKTVGGRSHVKKLRIDYFVTKKAVRSYLQNEWYIFKVFWTAPSPAWYVLYCSKMSFIVESCLLFWIRFLIVKFLSLLLLLHAGMWQCLFWWLVRSAGLYTEFSFEFHAGHSGLFSKTEFSALHSFKLGLLRTQVSSLCLSVWSWFAWLISKFKNLNSYCTAKCSQIK